MERKEREKNSDSLTTHTTKSQDFCLKKRLCRKHHETQTLQRTTGGTFQDLQAPRTRGRGLGGREKRKKKKKKTRKTHRYLVGGPRGLRAGGREEEAPVPPRRRGEEEEEEEEPPQAGEEEAGRASREEEDEQPWGGGGGGGGGTRSLKALVMLPPHCFADCRSVTPPSTLPRPPAYPTNIATVNLVTGCSKGFFFFTILTPALAY